MPMGLIAWRKATIADGAALSNAVDMTGQRLVAIMQPANCEGTAFGLKASFDNDPNGAAGTFTAVYNVIQESTGAAPVTALWEIAKSATVTQYINLPDAFRVLGPAFIKIQTEDGSNAASNQTGAAVIWLAFEEVNLNG